LPNEDLKTLLAQFAEGAGFGDPDARQNAELRLKLAQAEEQLRISGRLNLLTLLLVLVGLLNAVILGFQVWGK